MIFMKIKKNRAKSAPASAAALGGSPAFKKGKSTKNTELTDFKSHTDIEGSWTGTPYDGGKPVQDADDL